MGCHAMNFKMPVRDGMMYEVAHHQLVVYGGSVLSE